MTLAHMERSESLMEFTKALSKFQGEITSVKKTSVNPFFKSKYADLDAVWEMCRKPLSSNGFALVQMPVEIEGKLYLETLLIHTSGEYIKGYLALNPKAIDPQSVGSAITYARRYAMSAMLGVSADEDDDAEKATARGAVSRQPSAISRQGRGLKADSFPAEGSVITGVCTIPGHNGAKLVQSRRTGVWGHILEDGTPCLGGTTEPDDDTPLGNLQRELAREGWNWTAFEQMVLHMPWPEWVKLDGTIETARKHWANWAKLEELAEQEA